MEWIVLSCTELTQLGVKVREMGGTDAFRGLPTAIKSLSGSALLRTFHIVLTTGAVLTATCSAALSERRCAALSSSTEGRFHRE